VRAAAVDAGSNTILLVVGEADDPAKGHRIIRDEIDFARLGEGVDRVKRLSEAAFSRGLEAFRRYAAICSELEVRAVKVTGTSALRDASNGAEFAKAVHAATGWTLEIISGRREAELGFSAATDDFEPGHPAVVLDVGGGSLQLIDGRARKGIGSAVSLDIGAVRMTERFLPDDPPTWAQMETLRTHLRRMLEGSPRPEGDFEVVGVSGTCTTLAAISLGLREYDSARIHGIRLERPEIERLFRAFMATDSAGRARMPGLHPKRADVIVAGTAAVLEVLERYGKASLRISDRGIRHAILRLAFLDAVDSRNS
jgi:exopolyphosphatase/guanosine-5'-triphosphate,3'-diphosphate pyrophosphatase